MNSVDVSETGPVEGWLDIAVAAIDAKFGSGYAKANPVLVGAYVQAAAICAVRTALADDIVNALDGIEKAAGGTANH